MLMPAIKHKNKICQWIRSLPTREGRPAELMAERIAALKAVADEQYRLSNRLEDWLAEARRQHGTTMSKLNALYAERSRSRAE